MCNREMATPALVFTGTMVQIQIQNLVFTGTMVVKKKQPVALYLLSWEGKHGDD